MLTHQIDNVVARKHVDESAHGGATVLPNVGNSIQQALLQNGWGCNDIITVVVDLCFHLLVTGSERIEHVDVSDQKGLRCACYHHQFAAGPLRVCAGSV